MPGDSAAAKLHVIRCDPWTVFSRFTVGGEVAESVMREFQQAYDDFKVVETKSGIFWRRVQGRSLWSSVHTQKMVALAEKGRGGWMPNDAMKARVIERWSGITQTKLIEDGVREERVELESRRSFNRKMSSETCWDKLCASDIHAQKHRFTRLPFETTVVPRAEKDRSVKSLFAVKPSQVFKGTRAVVRDHGRGGPPLDQAMLSDWRR